MTDEKIKQIALDALAMAYLQDDKRLIFKSANEYFRCVAKIKEKFND